MSLCLDEAFRRDVIASSIKDLGESGPLSAESHQTRVIPLKCERRCSSPAAAGKISRNVFDNQSGCSLFYILITSLT